MFTFSLSSTLLFVINGWSRIPENIREVIFVSLISFGALKSLYLEEKIKYIVQGRVRSSTIKHFVLENSNMVKHFTPDISKCLSTGMISNNDIRPPLK